MKKIRLGIYEHYSGKKYMLIGVGKHSETLEDMAIYQAEYDTRKLWVRPLKMFLEKIEIGGKIVPRFKLIDENEH